MLNPSINENHPVVMKLKCDLPPNAESVYVKDFVGNVSTTNWRKNGELEIRPRFPLFGGWKYTWWHGYDVPITQGVESLGNDIYILSVDVHQNIAESPADVAVWKAVLPEGATDIRILNAPWFFEHKIETTFSYFDTIGRPTVVIKQNNFYPFYLTKFRVILINSRFNTNTQHSQATGK